MGLLNFKLSSSAGFGGIFYPQRGGRRKQISGIGLHIAFTLTIVKSSHQVCIRLFYYASINIGSVHVIWSQQVHTLLSH